MKTIAAILALHPVSSIRIVNDGWMPLTIERIGHGPNGHPSVSVCHYGEQNGDLMRDPEMCFEVIPASGATAETWAPYYFRNDYAGIEQEVYSADEAGRQLVRTKLLAELRSFARTWDRNLREQGFVEAARLQRTAALEAERADLRTKMLAAAAAPLVAPASFSTQADFFTAQTDLFA